MESWLRGSAKPAPFSSEKPIHRNSVSGRTPTIPYTARRTMLMTSRVPPAAAAVEPRWPSHCACFLSQTARTTEEACETQPGGTAFTDSGPASAEFRTTRAMSGCLRWALQARWPAMWRTSRCCYPCRRGSTHGRRFRWRAPACSFEALYIDPSRARIAWGGEFRGHAPCEPGVLEVCRSAALSLQSLGCVVEDALPEFDFDALWQATIRLRGWQQGAPLLAFYKDRDKRAMLKPEAIFEIETGLRQSAYDITAASNVRGGWTQTVRRFFETYDFLILPTAQVFPFDIDLHWPREVAGQSMKTYHEWMKGTLLVSMCGCPALAVPAGFSSEGLPIGIQIIAPNRT